MIKTVQIIPSSFRTKNGLDFQRMDSNQAAFFDTYRNWAAFQLPLDPTPDKDKEEGNPTNGQGVRSLFNNVSAVLIGDNVRLSNNMPLLDAPGMRARQRAQTACTISDLVNKSSEGLMGRQIYSYADFAYCKYLGRISNNYLITLRRFPVPCGDHIDYTIPDSELEKKTQDHTPDIGRLVTWMGTPGNEMGNILKWDVKMNFEEKKAELKDEDLTGDSTTPLAQMFNSADPAYQKQVQQGLAGANVSGQVDKAFDLIGLKAPSGGDVPYSSWRGWRDSNKVYGPLDVMMRTHVRGQGIEFNQSISLTFEYELRSYDGVNGKAAMMDLLGNILAVTYTNGKFWGGGYRNTGAHQSNVFANLPIFKLAENGGLGDSTAVLNSFSDSITVIGNDLKAKGNGDTVQGIIETLKGIGGMLLGGILNKLGRPQKMAVASLLTEAPVGLWHLTIGNPCAPIMTIGNLIMEKAEVEHFGPLGLDDFPTGIRVKVTLKHGKDRDSNAIERMYLRGDNREYIQLGGDIMKMYDNAYSVKAKTRSIQETIQNDKQNEQQKQIENGQTSMETQDIATLSSNPTTNIDMIIDKSEMLLRNFGTTNTKNIKLAGAEAFHGSVKDRPKNKKK